MVLMLLMRQRKGSMKRRLGITVVEVVVVVFVVALMQWSSPKSLLGVLVWYHPGIGMGLAWIGAADSIIGMENRVSRTGEQRRRVLKLVPLARHMSGTMAQECRIGGGSLPGVAALRRRPDRRRNRLGVPCRRARTVDVVPGTTGRSRPRRAVNNRVVVMGVGGVAIPSRGGRHRRFVLVSLFFVFISKDLVVFTSPVGVELVVVVCPS